MSEDKVLWGLWCILSRSRDQNVVRLAIPMTDRRLSLCWSVTSFCLLPLLIVTIGHFTQDNDVTLNSFM